MPALVDQGLQAPSQSSPEDKCAISEKCMSSSFVSVFLFLRMHLGISYGVFFTSGEAHGLAWMSVRGFVRRRTCVCVCLRVRVRACMRDFKLMRAYVI